METLKSENIITEEKIRDNVFFYPQGIKENLWQYFSEHPEARYVVYFGEEEDEIIWAVSHSAENEDVDELLRIIYSNPGFYKLTLWLDYVPVRLGGYAYADLPL